MELTPALGVGVSDLHHAARAEVVRILKEADGDEAAQTKLLIRKLHDLELIADSEVDTLSRLCEIGVEAGAGRRDAKQAYFETRDLHNSMLAHGHASPVALALASSSVGSYTITEDPDGSGPVIFAKAGGNWEGRLGVAGAIIGGALGGGLGATIGGAVGGIVGAVVDECKK
jgi:hypothetical protein